MADFSRFEENPSAVGRGGASETPLYQSRVGVEPIASPQNAQAALGQVSGAIDRLGDLGASVASNAAQTRATYQALEDAKNPSGYEPFPAFTNADKAYVQTYNQQSLNVLTHQGQIALDKSFLDYSANPTPQGLLEYEQIGRDTVDNLSSLGTNANRQQIQMSLDGAFQSNFNRLAGAVQSKARQEQLSNYKASYDQGLENQYNYGTQGMWDSLLHQTESLKANTQHAYDAGLINVETKEANLKSIAIQERTAHQMNGLLEAERNGKGDAYLKSFVENPPGDLTPTDIETIGASMYKHLSQTRALKSGQQQIDYTHAMMAVDTGELTPSSFEEWRGRLSGEQFASVERAYQTQQLNQIKAQRAVVDLNANAGSAYRLSDMSDKDFQAGFDQLVSQSNYSEDPILNAAIVTSNIKRDNPGFTKQLEETLTYGGTEESLSAAEAVTYLQNQNSGQSIQGMDKQSRAIGELYKLYRRNPELTPEKALEQARNQVLKTDKSTYEIRAEVLKQKLSEKGLDTESIRKRINETLSINKAFARKILGREPTIIPDDATAAYTNALISYSLNGLDYTEANKNAVMDVIASYPETNINGVPERMAYADKMPYGNDVERNRQNMTLAIQALVQRNKRAQQEGIPLTQKLDYDPKTGAFTVNGVVREVRVKGDYLTDIKRGAAWAFYVVDDRGLQLDLIDPSAPDRKARWIPKAVKTLEERP